MAEVNYLPVPSDLAAFDIELTDEISQLMGHTIASMEWQLGDEKVASRTWSAPEDAACANLNSDIFFPDEDDPEMDIKLATAKQACSTCPLQARQQCLNHTILYPYQHVQVRGTDGNIAKSDKNKAADDDLLMDGVWGGWGLGARTAIRSEYKARYNELFDDAVAASEAAPELIPEIWPSWILEAQTHQSEGRTYRGAWVETVTTGYTYAQFFWENFEFDLDEYHAEREVPEFAGESDAWIDDIEAEFQVVPMGLIAEYAS